MTKNETTTLRRLAAVVPAALLATALLAAPVAASTDAGGDDASLAVEFEEELFDEFVEGRVAFPDPLESLNRYTLRFNRGVDRWVLDPVTNAYRYAVPAPMRKSVRHFLSNLDTPVVLINDLLQRQWHDAGTTVARFAINTTAGVGGLFDPATGAGWTGHTSDFGQTLALEGVPSGPYVVLPVLGPTTLRDGTGDLVDLVFRPMTYVLGPAGRVVYATLHGGSVGLSTRDEVADELRMLEESSIDFYAALRNAYFQNRNSIIEQRLDEHQPLTAIAAAWWDTAPAGEVHASSQY